MKVCLHTKFYDAFGGDDKIRGGLIASIENQKKVMDLLGIQYTENPKEEWDILVINIPWPTSVGLARRAKKQGKKVIMWGHVSAEDLFQSVRVLQYMKWLKPLVWKYLISAYSVGDVILCPSAYATHTLEKFGIPKEKLAVQSNGVNTKLYYKDPALREQYRAKRSLTGLVMGTVALVLPERKGVDTLLNLAEAFPQRQFYWFGKIFSPALVAPVPKPKFGNVHFTGFEESILAALNGIDIFVFPSREENQGMSLLEAAAVGLPILARNLPAYEGWLVHDKNCLIAKTEGEFEVHLRALLEDEQLRNRLSAAALQLAQDESLEVQAQKMKRMYEKLYASMNVGVSTAAQ